MLFSILNMMGESVKKSFKNCPSKNYFYFKLLKLLITKENTVEEILTLCSHSN